jgi:OFA family oxalate/formate antiporter-like MFS transporter
VLFETWLVPVEGWFVDKYGPASSFSSAALCAIGWVINARHHARGYHWHDRRRHRRRRRLHLVGNALKWFRQARPRSRHHRS